MKVTWLTRSVLAARREARDFKKRGYERISGPWNNGLQGTRYHHVITDADGRCLWQKHLGQSRRTTSPPSKRSSSMNKASGYSAQRVDGVTDVMPPLPTRIMAARDHLFDKLNRLSKLADDLCGSVPAEVSKPDGAVQATFFGMVEHSTESMNAVATQIDEICGRIERRIGL